MQDYIFNSKSRDQQRAHKRKLRFLGLLIIAAGAVAGIYFTSTQDPRAIVTPQDSNNNSSSEILMLPAAGQQKTQASTSTPPIDTSAHPDNNLGPVNASKAHTSEPQITLTNTPDKATVTTATTILEPETSSADSQPITKLSWIDHAIKPGESLSAIFKQHNLSASLLHKIINSSEAATSLAKVRPGQTVRFGMDKDQQLLQLTLERDRISSLHISLSENGITSQEQKQDLTRREKSTSGIINSSLFVDGQAAGLSDKLIMELAKVFGWDIDFALDVMPGDSFSLIYEEHYLQDEKLSEGPILAAEFVNQGKTFRAVRYTNSEDNANYYDDSGHAKQRAFLRTPVKFARISSRFTRKRWHPVLKKWRSHKGVDYAAPRGTPVKAAGTGKIVFKGKKGGYGNVIFLRHGGRYTTVYGHLSKFSRGIKKGGKVKQGQVIGYVGSTGLATGPHLHYEFRVNGVHRNPLTVKLPKSMALPKKQMDDFRQQTAPLLSALEKEKTTSMLALAK